jgi:hypothetical protein
MVDFRIDCLLVEERRNRVWEEGEVERFQGRVCANFYRIINVAGKRAVPFTHFQLQARSL